MYYVSVTCCISHYQAIYWDQVSANKNLQKGGVCIVCKDVYFSKINTSCNCKEEDLEICAIELKIK
jgi:hypothetical protein